MAIVAPSWLRWPLRIVTDVESPQTYAVLRIGLGALLIANVSTLWPILEYLYSDHGMAPAARVCGQGMARLSIPCHLPTTWGLQVFLVVFTAVALAFTLGLATRVTGIVAVALNTMLWWRGALTYVAWLTKRCFPLVVLGLYDRRQKVHAALTERNNPKLRTAHARWVCHTWRDAAGQPPAEVVLSRIEELLPSPSWAGDYGPGDPHDSAAMPSREVELSTVRCDDP